MSKKEKRRFGQESQTEIPSLLQNAPSESGGYRGRKKRISPRDALLRIRLLSVAEEMSLNL